MEYEARQQARLAWRCRRGMRELDLLLLGFLQQTAGALSPLQAEQLEQLLQYSDEVLLAWLLQRAEPTDPALQGLVAQIRQGAHAAG